MALTATTFNKDHYVAFSNTLTDLRIRTALIIQSGGFVENSTCSSSEVIGFELVNIFRENVLPNISLLRMRRRGMQMSAAGVGFDNDQITSTDELNTFLIPLFPA